MLFYFEALIRFMYEDFQEIIVETNGLEILNLDIILIIINSHFEF